MSRSPCRLPFVGSCPLARHCKTGCPSTVTACQISLNSTKPGAEAPHDCTNTFFTHSDVAVGPTLLRQKPNGIMVDVLQTADFLVFVLGPLIFVLPLPLLLLVVLLQLPVLRTSARPHAGGQVHRSSSGWSPQCRLVAWIAFGWFQHCCLPDLPGDVRCSIGRKSESSRPDEGGLFGFAGAVLL